MSSKPGSSRRIDAAALRGLNALERTLKNHARDLMALDCDNIEVAACIVYALELTENALEKTRDTNRRICGGAKPARAEDQRPGR